MVFLLDGNLDHVAHLCSSKIGLFWGKKIHNRKYNQANSTYAHPFLSNHLFYVVLGGGVTGPLPLCLLVVLFMKEQDMSVREIRQ